MKKSGRQRDSVVQEDLKDLEERMQSRSRGWEITMSIGGLFLISITSNLNLRGVLSTRTRAGEPIYRPCHPPIPANSLVDRPDHKGRTAVELKAIVEGGIGVFRMLW